MKFLNYKFKDAGLIERALTHSSKSEVNYERLEFLGDSILDFLVGEYFYKHCEESEGKLTVLRSQYVSENHLAKVFDTLKLTKYVKMGKSYQGELSKAIKADVIEAVLGAIYLDGGLNEAKKFIESYLDLDNYQNMVDENYKSKLQELVQGNFKCKMAYHTEAVDDGFKSTFYMDEDAIASGQGKTKTQAEQRAAQKAIKKLFLV